MNKITKRVGILLLLGIMVFALCGCDALDEMREHQIFPESDGSIIIDGVRYIALDTNDYFGVEIDYEQNAYYLTNPDVPVLLSQDYCIGRINVSKDLRFCHDGIQGMYFCREELFPEVQAKNREPFSPDILSYHYYTIDNLGQFNDEIYILSEEETAAIKDVLENTAPLQLGDGIYISYDWSMGLNVSTKDMLFHHPGPGINKAGSTYYLDIYTGNQSLTYQVPNHYNALFENMTVAFVRCFINP